MGAGNGSEQQHRGGLVSQASWHTLADELATDLGWIMDWSSQSSETNTRHDAVEQLCKGQWLGV